MNKLEELHPDLQPWVVEMDIMGTMVKHPFLFIHYNPAANGTRNPDGTDVPFTASYINAAYLNKKEYLDTCLRSSDYSGYVYAHEKPHAVEALHRVWEKGLAWQWRRSNQEDAHTIKKEFFSLMASVWKQTEFPHQRADLWLKLFKIPGTDLLMSETDFLWLDATRAAQEQLTIYRGSSHIDLRLGLSWTLSLEKARWFADRFDDESQMAEVVEGLCDPNDVLAFFSERGESEILIHPNNVTVTCKTGGSIFQTGIGWVPGWDR